MNSRQGTRYIKRRISDDLKNEILAHNGIIFGDNNLKAKPSVIICYRCSYLCSTEDKYCPKCIYPLTIAAHEEIKAEEDKRFHEIEEKHQSDIKLLQQSMENKLNEQKEEQQSMENKLNEQKEEQARIINRFLSLLIKESMEGKTVLGKKTLKSLVNGKRPNLAIYTTDCDYNDPMFFSARAKDLLPVKKVLEEKKERQL